MEENRRVNRYTNSSQQPNRHSKYSVNYSREPNMVGKYSYEEEQEALSWIEDTLHDRSIFIGGQGMKMMGDSLRDGIHLCRLVENIQHGVDVRINRADNSKPLSESKCKENIGMFLEYCRLLGVQEEDLFEVVDLYEGTKLHQVIRTVITLKRKYVSSNNEGTKYHQDTPRPVEGTQFRYSNLIM